MKIVSCIAWADGHLNDNEKAEMLRLAKEFGGVHPSEANDTLISVKTLDEVLLNEVKTIPPIEAHSILKIAFRIANADGSITPEELDIIRKISAAIMPDKPWEKIHTWIIANDAFLKATRDLFH